MNRRHSVATAALGTLLVALALIAHACGDSDYPATHIPLPPAGVAPFVYDVNLETRQLVDTTRSTPANGAAPATAQRNLPTDLRVPVALPDAGAHPTTPADPLAQTLAIYGGGTACTPQTPGPQTPRPSRSTSSTRSRSPWWAASSTRIFSARRIRFPRWPKSYRRRWA